MRSLLIKEMRLSASVLSYAFIVFGLMFLLPGYPILCGVFFSCLGIFQRFHQRGRLHFILIKTHDRLRFFQTYLCVRDTI